MGYIAECRAVDVSIHRACAKKLRVIERVERFEPQFECSKPRNLRQIWFSDITGERTRGKTVTKPCVLNGLGLPLNEKQIPQVENLDSGGKPREALETVGVLVRQAL